jgi:hypothetical protein
LDVLSNTIYITQFINARYIEPLQVLTYFGGYPEPQNIPLIKQKHPLTSIPTTTLSAKVICNPFLIKHCLNTAHLLTGLTHFVRQYNSFYICHAISGFYTFITQIHFLLIHWKWEEMEA